MKTGKVVMCTFRIFVFFVYAIMPIIADENFVLSDLFIDKINSKQQYWTAGRNFHPNTPYAHLKRLAGTIPNLKLRSETPIMKHDPAVIASLPENFDPREKWPFCPTLNEIRDQGSCGSCYAVGTASVMTDRYCIHAGGKQHFRFSDQDLMTCCPECGISCEGGNNEGCWNHWHTAGIVSGGSYGSNQGCKPYLVPPCEHNATGSLPPCGPYLDPMRCYKTCEPNYKVDYEHDRRFGKPKVTFDTDENHIKAELFLNGPVTASIVLYEDFMTYKSGVYVHTVGKRIGHHTIKLMGWGVENGTKYWLLSNSFNADWGDNGFIKILRGKNHCSVEDGIIAALPLYPEFTTLSPINKHL
ncbi:unnamed protein product [Chrysodeixis includens]|uniref:Peptidase C1A papain C-terminal domain-containing protein n=1 Tax=Chrysodeixis includens TaxID=689277 RepID=A0A9P0FPP9_CHRIL|nr:unnamed protein product [Chrysodeixis includens]